MTTAQLPRGRIAPTLIAALAWFGVLLQLWLSLRGGKSVAAGLVAFFGFFTVLTNILVALVVSLPLAFGGTTLGRWFGTDTMRGCATTAIVFVGIAYHFLLRNLWAPEGGQWVADMTLHYAVPVALLVYWIWSPPRQKISALAPLTWCVYPVMYFVYALLRGELIGSYPYHFIDAANLGYGRTLLNAVGLLVLFAGLGSLVQGIARLRSAAGAN